MGRKVSEAGTKCPEASKTHARVQMGPTVD